MQVKGRLAAWLVADAAESAEHSVERLLVLAVSAWRARGFDSFDRSENALTVRLYAHCMDAVRSSSDFSLFQVSWEAPVPSAAILEGQAAPATSARPDMYFSVGSRKLLFEAKRLDGSTTLYRQYVVEGMRRYWDGRYSSNPGLLFAYLIGPSHGASVAGINEAVKRVHACTRTDERCLFQRHMVTSDLSKSSSVYPENGALWHFALAV